jgi:uncharacterized protein
MRKSIEASLTEHPDVASVEGFYEKLAAGNLVSSRCRKCSSLFVPPTSLCTKCYSTNLVEIKLSGEGILITFTIVHVSAPELQHLAPYAVAVIQLEEGPFVLGMLKGTVDLDKMSLGIPVRTDFDASRALTPGTTRLVFRLDSGGARRRKNGR